MYIPILVLELTVYHMPIAVDNSKWSLLYVTYQSVCRFQRFLQCVISNNFIERSYHRLKKTNKMQLYADIYLLLNYSTCFGHHYLVTFEEACSPYSMICTRGCNYSFMYS